MAPGDGDVSMARELHSKPWKSGDLNQVLQGLEVSGSVYFLKTLGRPQPNLKFGQCDQLILPFCFMKEHAEIIEEWVILRTFSSSKPWRVRVHVDRNSRGSVEVRFVGGWREFAAENRLREGDSLIFVLKLDARSEFEVYIFRGTSVSAASSQVPAGQWPIWERMSGCKVEKDAKFSGRYTLRSVGDGNMRGGGEVYTGKKRKVDEAPSSCFDDEHRSGLESEAFTGCECKRFSPQHGTNPLPSFRRPIKSFVVKDGRLEIPASFVRMHGMRLQDDVKLQGIHQESPVYSVTLGSRIKQRTSNERRLFFQTGWKTFLNANGLQEGQELNFTLTADSFFTVRVVQGT
ncbi:hypothetical protein M758_4G040700 [Ceratodon purpureus]|nr:hypothetical protein M758_4G040700 [Ceratodon purpureus]